MNPCPLWDDKQKFVTAWNGLEVVTLEVYLDPPNVTIGETLPTLVEYLWVLVNLMTEPERITLGWNVLNSLELNSPFPILRDNLDAMDDFVNGIITRAELDVHCDTLRAYQLLNNDGSTPEKILAYKHLDAVLLLMTDGDTLTETMSICRLCENAYPNSTYDDFITETVRLLKGE